MLLVAPELYDLLHIYIYRFRVTKIKHRKLKRHNPIDKTKNLFSNHLCSFRGFFVIVVVVEVRF